MDQVQIDVIIPAYNEADSIGLVLNEVDRALVREVVVCNNASTDDTEERAIEGGATVIHEPRKGYGSACLRGISYLTEKENPPDVVVFMDADYSDFASEMSSLVHPIIHQNLDLVIGSRALGIMERGAMTPQQIFGNWLATNLIRLFYNYHFTDLGPYRAIKFDVLKDMKMQDKDFGWTVEMQVRAAKMKLKTTEVPVSYRRRVGVSKISGTVRGTILAGHKILWTIFKLI